MFIVATAASIGLHAAAIAYGRYHDAHASITDPRYTDIDYWVMLDAANLLRRGHAPYDRPTYRYTPVFALLLAAADWLMGSDGGKVVFSGFSLISGWLIYRLLRLQSITRGKATAIASISWLLNPFVVGIATRGSAESVVCATVLAFVYALACGRRDVAAALLGLATHLKLYPGIYLPAALVYLGLLRTHGRGRGAPGSVAGTPIKQAGHETPAHAVGTPIKSSLQTRPHGTIGKCVRFFTIFAMSFSIPLAFTMVAYGRKGLYESLFYHLVRQDHRHNFSPYWLMYYHNCRAPVPYLKLASFLPFVAQSALLLTIAMKYGRRDFCFAVFLQTLVFVTFNKVITSQYFMWYLALLPVVVPALGKADWHEWVAIVGVWIGGQAAFLSTAYGLEFEGSRSHMQVWMGSMLFFVSHVALAAQFIRMHSRTRAGKAI